MIQSGSLHVRLGPLRPWRSFKALLGYLSAQGGARRTRLPARINRCGPPKSNLAAMQSVLWEKRFDLHDKDNRRFVLRLACLVCGACRRIRIISPLHNRVHSGACERRVHRAGLPGQPHELHRSGNEAAWWRKLNADPMLSDSSFGPARWKRAEFGHRLRWMELGCRPRDGRMLNGYVLCESCSTLRVTSRFANHNRATEKRGPFSRR